MMTPEQSAKNERLYMQLIVFFVCSLFILGIPYIVMLFLIAGTILFTAQFLLTLRIDRHVAAFALLLIYILGWGLATGGFHPASLMQPAFLGGEGRIIIAYMPIFLIFAAPRRMFTERNMMHIFRIMFYLSACMMPLSVIGLSKSLFGSHHAAGYAAGSLFITFVCLSSEEGRRWHYTGIMIAVILLMMANSRTTLVGLTFAFGIFFYHRILTLKTVILGALAVAALGFVWSILSPFSFARFALLFDEKLWSAIGEQAAVASDFHVLEAASVERTGTNWNILTRIILFVRAWGFFEISPILGIGSFRYNDLGIFMVDVMPGVTVAASHFKPVVSVATAHNSYLQVLAEGGLVGLGIYLMPWLMILFTLRRRRRGTAMQRALRKMSIILILFMAFGSLTGHLLAAPSMTLWVVFISGLALRFTAPETALK